MPLLPDPEGAGIDAILLFPVPRSLAVMPDLDRPGPIATYAARLSEHAGVPLVDAPRAAG